MFKSIRREIQAVLARDPAARNALEVVLCYPGFWAILMHRPAHWLYHHHGKLLARVISQLTRHFTGIEIHPGAVVGKGVFIDHGMGVVIGETCIIGNSCRLYQGVTLGALSFPKNADGTLTKGIPRHPILEDKVTVYAGATILGRVTVGRGAVIGGNVWITDDVPAGAKVTQERPS